MNRWSNVTAAVLAATVIAGCGGGVPPAPGSNGLASGSAAASQQLHARAILAVHPQQIDFAKAATQTVHITGGVEPYTVTQTNPEVASLNGPVKTRAGWTFTASAVAGGTTTISVKDSKGTAVFVGATQFICPQPVPALVQANPANGASGVSINVGRTYYTSNRLPDTLRALRTFYVRLLGSNGLTYAGSSLRTFAHTGATEDWFSTVPQLAGSTTYRVQYASLTMHCLPPAFTGNFST